MSDLITKKYVLTMDLTKFRSELHQLQTANQTNHPRFCELTARIAETEEQLKQLCY